VTSQLYKESESTTPCLLEERTAPANCFDVVPSVRKAVRPAMGEWDKVLKHKGVYPSPFWAFPLPPLRYVTDCLVCGPRLLCTPAMAQRSRSLRETMASAGKWCE
jgi:hypothetical protein